MSIRIRFVASDSTISRLIRLQAGTSMPFSPSHTEALTQDGQFYIGAHINGGVQKRPVGYDDYSSPAMILPDGTKADRIVEIPCPGDQEAAFYHFVTDKIGTPYDWKAIIGFVGEKNLHTPDRVICSAFMAAALRACSFFKKPLTVPFHGISPRDLLLVLSSHVEITH